MSYMSIYNFTAILVLSFAMFSTLLYSYYGKQKLLFYVGLCQSFFILEIFNICIGSSKAKLFPTIVQLFSRNFILWVVAYLHKVRSNQFTIMLMCWFISDIVRYLFYFFRNNILKALRYNLFLVLYPVGTLIEIFLLSQMDLLYKGVISLTIRAIMIIYIPGFTFLFVHMLKRRRYTMKTPQNLKKKQ